MPIAEECFEGYTTLEGEQTRLFRKDCAYADLIAQGKVLKEAQLNDIEDISLKLKADEWGDAFVIVTVPKEARGPQGWFAVDDVELQKKVVRIARQRYRDWLKENGEEEEE